MNIITKLQCPVCYGRLIKKKKICCEQCKRDFKINHGIIDLLVKSQDIQKEINENKEVAEKRKKKSDDWLLSLPCADNFGNEKHPIINQGYKANVLQALNLVNVKGKSILEIGAGTCWTTALLAEAGADVVATDISAEKYVGLESGEVFFKHKTVFFERVLCSMETLPFQNKSFDIVFVNAAIHHAPDINLTFKEIARVLKEEGIYIQTNEPVSSIFSKSHKINIQKAKAAGMDVSENWNENSYSLIKYKDLLKHNGFRYIQVIFPESFDMLLRNATHEMIYGYKKKIKSIISKVWGFKLCKQIMSSSIIFNLSLYVFGGNCIIIGKK